MKKKFLVLPVALIAFSVFTLACGPTAAVDPTPAATTVPTPAEVPPPTSAGLSQDELTALQAELDANIEKWQHSGVIDYEFEFRVNCFCPTDITSPVTIKVMDTNSIDQITYTDSGIPVTEYQDMYLTVGGMFDIIQEGIDTKVANLTVTYDSELGFPTEAFIDRDFLMADEERGFTTSNLKVIETPTLDEIQAQLDASRRLWESNAPASYQIEYQRICFCPEDIRSPVVVAVNDGVIASRTYVETGQAVSEAFQDLFIDVPGLFEIVQDAMKQDADRIRVEFDPVLGHPTSINIDYKFLMADEEVGFTVRSFK